MLSRSNFLSSSWLPPEKLNPKTSTFSSLTYKIQVICDAIHESVRTVPILSQHLPTSTWCLIWPRMKDQHYSGSMYTKLYVNHISHDHLEGPRNSLLPWIKLFSYKVIFQLNKHANVPPIRLAYPAKSIINKTHA